MKKGLMKNYKLIMSFFVCLLLVFALAFGMTVPMTRANAETVGSIFFDDTIKATSADDSLERANAINEKIVEEGAVLLKNKASALPIASSTNISVFGKNTVNAVHGGSGSSGGSGSGDTDIYSALSSAGFTVNPSLVEFYNDSTKSGTGRPTSPSIGQYPVTGFATGETPVASYDATLKGTFANYDDAAIVMLSRIGGEGFDLPRKSVDTEGRSDATEHYLELDDNEKDLLQMVTGSFDKVILVLNTSAPMELGFIEDDTYGEIDSAIWLGLPGGSGFNALGSILTGDVTPSGHLVDTYSADFTKDPTWNNFADNRTERGSTSAGGDEYSNATTGARSEYYTVSYEEGIYVGYRYYETRGFSEDTTDTWYDANVVYPFGYGLSYTTFDWEVDFSDNAAALDKDNNTEITVSVKVKNTGSVKGKDVVQLYYSAPYTAGGIEKAHVVLGGFAKTSELDPNETETVTITLNAKDMASYDYATNKCYVLEAGDYDIYVGKNAHDAWKTGDKETYTVDTDITYEYDLDGEADGDNQFDDVTEGVDTVLSRNDWTGTWPSVPTTEDLSVSAAFITELSSSQSMSVAERNEDDENQPWYVAEEDMPTQSETEFTGEEENIVKLADLFGADYNDSKWDEFLDQLTVAQLSAFVADGFFQTHPVEALGVPDITTPDGPTGYTSNMAGRGEARCFYACPTLVATTWSEEIAEEQGEAMGEEGLWMGYSGMYAPATNTHRNQFGGRNFEYYSEDGFIAGKIAAANVRGLQSKGVMPFVKHFAVNDQETHRDSNGLITWATEQAMREIYFKSFQFAVEEGGAMGMMSSFNRLGTTWTGSSYALLTNVLRNEWGFTGIVITDWAAGGYMNQDAMIRAGNDMYLGMKFGTWQMFGGPSTSEEACTATHVTALRKATKNICYTVLKTNIITGADAYPALKKAYDDAQDAIAKLEAANAEQIAAAAEEAAKSAAEIAALQASAAELESKIKELETAADAGCSGSIASSIALAGTFLVGSVLFLVIKRKKKA